MEDKIQGWVIINIGFPKSGKKYIVSDYFNHSKRICINEFAKGSAAGWRYWRNKFNYRCVRAEQTIKTITNE